MEKAKTWVTLTFTTASHCEQVCKALHHQVPPEFKKHVMLFYAKNPPQEEEATKVRIRINLNFLNQRN